MFRICSWNVRGLNNPSNRNAVRLVVSNLRNVVVCLQDTKVHYVSRSFLRSFGGPSLDKRMFVEANGASGGLITCWNSKVFECIDAIVRSFSLTLRLCHQASGVRFFITNVYGPPRWEEKDAFCTKISRLKSECEGNWVVCGDFNFTKSQEERVGKVWSSKATCMFNELIFDLALINMPMKNSRYTWSSMQRSPDVSETRSFSRIDGVGLVFPESRGRGST